MTYRIVRILLFLVVSIPSVVSDLKTKRIPNLIMYPGIVLALILAVVQGWSPLVESVLGGLIGFIVFWLLWRLSGGKLGLGDAKYSAFIGALVSFEYWCVAIFLAALTGLIAAAILLCRDRRYRHYRVPFAPFLAFGGIVTVGLSYFNITAGVLLP
jgi:leader peptidase (prepilin peptidase) / N-methyltransferase